MILTLELTLKLLLGASWQPAFDVRPHKYLTRIVTVQGVVHPPFKEKWLPVMDSPAA
jgi:methylthioribose-1-phosphate isomerase